MPRGHRLIESFALEGSVPRWRYRLADALLAAGRAGEALGVTDDCLARDPGNPSALAARSLALREVGRDGASARLLDWSRLVQTADVDPPAGRTGRGA